MEIETHNTTKRLTTVYGPVPSWRLGKSLGIDPILPPKTCTFDCIYCQLGKTKNKISLENWRVTKVSVSMVAEDLKSYIDKFGIESIDYITFSGSGEPTLNPDLGKMIKAVKRIAPSIPIAVLTNSSLFSLKKVRENLLEADLVVAKLDAPTEEIFKAINRPSEKITLKFVVKGLKKLRRETSGKIAIQIMLLKAKNKPLNSDVNSVKRLIELVNEVSPDEVELNTPTRPPSEKYVSVLSRKELSEIESLFRDNVEAEIISVYKGKPLREKKPRKLAEDEVLLLLVRRPCKAIDIARALNVSVSEVEVEIKRLIKSGKVKLVEFRGQKYYKIT